ncbi:MAG: hypothetical protein ACPGQL_06855 [Thermoplasmatota archaeon]
MNRLLLLLSAALLVAAAPASAQTPLDPSATVSVTIEPGPMNVNAGGTHQMPFDVAMTVDNLLCPNAVTGRVGLAVEHFPSPLPEYTATVPDAFEFDVPAGAHSGLGGTAVSASGSLVLDLNIAANALQDHEHTFRIIATLDAASLSGCTTVAALPEATAQADHAVYTVPEPEPEDASTTMETTGGDAGGEGEDSPAPALLAPLALIGAALVARRRS